LIDDDPAYRTALAAVVQQDGRLELVGEAEGLAAGIEAVSILSADVAVIELALATAKQSWLLETVRRASPETRVLVVAERAESDTVRSVIASGASGYIEKAPADVTLASAIVAVGEGEAALSTVMLSQLVNTGSGPGSGSRPALTPREREIAALVAMGRSNAEIAERLFVSRETVKTHLTHIYRKLGVSGRTAAAAELMRRGLAEYPPPGLETPDPEG
jgi:DNA-binding NarL/FixJ family response regulator